jgi:hypothetical protein
MKMQQPKEVSNMEEEKILGQWGRMRRAYLMGHQPATFSTMVMRGELFPHLYQVDEQAELILEQMLNHYPAPDRNADPMAWVQHMNSVKVQAEEIIRKELIYV